MKRKFSIMFMLVFAALALVACGSKDEEGTSNDSKASKESNVFRVGMEAGYPPFNWTQRDDSNGAVKIDANAEYAGGYDVEIAKKIADGLGKELVIVKLEWDGLVTALQSGKIDGIIAGMSPTEKRKQTIDFTDNYYTSDFVMVLKKGSKYENATSIQDFTGAKITAQLNTSHYGVIDQIKGVEKVTAMENFPVMRVALQSGKIDGYVSERPEGISAAAANEEFTYISFEEGFEANEEDTAIAVGVRKDFELTADINEILATISEEDRQQIMEDAIKNQPAAQ